MHVQCASAFPQDALGLNLTAKGAARWVSRQWPRWQEWLQDLGMDAAHMLRSQRSLLAAVGPSNVGEDAGQQEYSMSSMALLALLTKWSLSLAGEGQSAATKLLHGLLHGLLPLEPLTWQVEVDPVRTAAPLRAPPTGASVAVKISQGLVDLRPLQGFPPVLKECRSQHPHIHTSTQRYVYLEMSVSTT